MFRYNLAKPWEGWRDQNGEPEKVIMIRGMLGYAKCQQFVTSMKNPVFWIGDMR